MVPLSIAIDEHAKNATIRHLIQTLLLRFDHSDHSESASATTTEGTDFAAAQATDGDADVDEGGTLPDLEGAVRRAAERITSRVSHQGMSGRP